MIRKNLLQLLFSGASMWRWNDKLRPAQLSEIEKQAHKMLVACVIWHETSQNLPAPEAASLAGKIIEGGLFDYFYRLVITDIKPPVFYKIRENRGHYQKLTEYVLGRLEPLLSPLGSFWNRLVRWHLDFDAGDEPDRRILAAAHLFASQWEFQLIQPHNPFDEEMEAIASSFVKGLDEYNDLAPLKLLRDPASAPGRFANLCGRLRFQIRWTQAPRIPATSVLGHMFMVASIAYFFSLSVKASQPRANNNFFSGLFHDFPEVLTRDIISPVKQSFSGLSELIREYEKSELERRVLAPLRKAGFHGLVERISYYLGLELGSEFKDCRRVNGKITEMTGFEETQANDRADADPKDGQLLKVCDLLSAFVEAHNSIRNGVTSTTLVEARARLKKELSGQPRALRLDALLADFD